MNRLRNGSIAVGAPGSAARITAEAADNALAEAEGSFLHKIKVGDRVWVGEARYGKGSAKILPVLSRTRTLIRVPYAGNGSPHDFRITQWEHDGSWHAYEIPSRMFSEAILGIATTEECTEYDTKQAEKSKETKAWYEEKLRLDALRPLLRALFTTEDYRNTNSLDVTDAQWGTKDERKGLFDVTFRGLTEAQVRELAAKIK